MTKMDHRNSERRMRMQNEENERAMAAAAFLDSAFAFCDRVTIHFLPEAE